MFGVIKSETFVLMYKMLVSECVCVCAVYVDFRRIDLGLSLMVDTFVPSHLLK